MSKKKSAAPLTEAAAGMGGGGGSLDPELARAVRSAVEEPVAPEDPLITRVQKWAHHVVMHSPVGFYMDTVQTVLSIVACFFYILSTYLEDLGPIPVWMIAFEWFVFCAFLTDYLIHLFIAENKLAHATSRGALVDLLSILPILTVSTNARIGFFRVLRVFRIIRILRGYRTFSAEGSGDADAGVSRQVGMLAFILLSFIFMGAGLIHSVEIMQGGTFYWPGAAECEFTQLEGLPRWELPPECRMDFFQAMYFVFVTVTTVGFGDMSPSDNLGRFIVLVVLLPLFLIIPREVAKLSELMERQSRFSRPFVPSLTSHVIVCGDIDYGVAVSFLSEFFHEDHGDQKMKVVFLAPYEPRGALEHLVSNPLFAEKVQYIRGSPLSTRDLSKAKLQTAQAVFVLTSQFSVDVSHRDVTAVLMVKAIKAITPWTSVFCQLLAPENKVHRRWSDWDHVVCLQELRMGLLAKSAICPGFSTLVSNLIMSSTQIDVETLSKDERHWMEEYMHGYGQEVYCMELSPAFSGHLFSVAAHKAFLMFGVCMFGIETQRVRAANVQSSVAASIAELDEAAMADETAGRERATRLQNEHLRKLGVRTSTAGLEESGLEVWRRERTERENAILLINPKDYIIRTGDKGLIIADNYTLALHMQEWDGSSFTIPHITPADKTTFRKLNNGRGPFLRDAIPKLSIPVDDPVPVQVSAAASLFESSSSDAGLGKRHSFASLSDSVTRRDSGGNIPVNPRSEATEPFSLRFRTGGASSSGEIEHSTPERKTDDTEPANVIQPPPHLTMLQAMGASGFISPAMLAARGNAKSPKPIRQPWPSGHGPVDDASNLQGHLVICGSVSDGLEYLLAPFRAESAKPIVIMHRELHPPAIPVPRALLRDVFFLHGNALNLLDLGRAGLATASCAIILANPSASPEEQQQEFSGVRDLEAVFTTCVIESNFRMCRIIVEILDPESLKFMNFNPSRDSLPRALWPQYACGRVYIATALDTLLCQAFYNSALIPVITRLIMGQRDDGRGGIAPAILPGSITSPPAPQPNIKPQHAQLSSLNPTHPPPPRGHSSSTSLEDDSIMNERKDSEKTTHPQRAPPPPPPRPKTPSDPDTASVPPPFGFATIIGPSGVTESVEENSRVMHMQVPTPYVNRYYKDLFAELVLTKGVLPLGIFRATDVHDSVLPYVLTNPSPITVLHPDDRLFILCSTSLVHSASHPDKNGDKDPKKARRRSSIDDSNPSNTRRSSIAGLAHKDAIRVAIAQTYLKKPRGSTPPPRQ